MLILNFNLTLIINDFQDSSKIRTKNLEAMFFSKEVSWVSEYILKFYRVWKRIDELIKLESSSKCYTDYKTLYI